MPNKKEQEFFNEMSEQSEVKTEIVRKYFWAWATVISRQIKKFGKNKIAYADLFAGRGRYEDGSPSTPIRILERAIKDPHIAPVLGTYFNDADSDNAAALEREIAAIPGINLLKYKPQVRSYRVDDSLAEKLEKWRVPTLFFLDPFGYKGLSLKLIQAALKPWGCDCIFFFNYNRINAALSNPVFTENMNTFFGQERAERLRANLEGKDSWERQQLIIDELKRALKELGGNYSIEYCFKDDSGSKTSHFLILASKNVLAYNIMKSIMGGESTSDDHGVPSFQYSPLDKERIEQTQRAPTLFEMASSPVDELAELLILEYAGRTMTVQEIYRNHHLGKRYLLKNYQDALKKLDDEGRIHTDTPKEKRMRGGAVTFGERVVVTFPSKETK